MAKYSMRFYFIIDFTTSLSLYHPEKVKEFLAAYSDAQILETAKSWFVRKIKT